MIKKIVDMGERMPTGYGIAYRDYACNRFVLYPIPLNYVVALVLLAHYHLMRGLYPNALDRQTQTATSKACGRYLEQVFKGSNIFPHFNSSGSCVICRNNHEGPTILAKVMGTSKDGIMEARQVHIGCLNLYYDELNAVLFNPDIPQLTPTEKEELRGLPVSEEKP